MTTRNGWSNCVPVFFVMALPGAAFVLPFHALVYWILGRRDERRAYTLGTSFPFPIEGYIELFGTSNDIASLTIKVTMLEGEEPPTRELVEDLLGQVNFGGQTTTSVIDGVLYIENTPPNDRDQVLYEWLCAVVREVLEPLHQASAIAKVSISGTGKAPEADE